MGNYEEDEFLSGILNTAQNDEAAKGLYTMFIGLVKAGFTRDEALQLVMTMIKSLIGNL